MIPKTSPNDPRPDRPLELEVEAGGEDARRLDRFLHERFPEQSRSQLARLIREQHVLLDGRPVKASQAIKRGQRIRIAFQPHPAHQLEPEEAPLPIIYQDARLAVLEKPPGLVTHPSPGHESGTLVHALLGMFSNLSTGFDPLRPGIVHRLDKDTSGLIVIAKDDAAHHRLAELFRTRQVHKQYLCIVEGLVMDESGRIDLPLGRSVLDRMRVTVRFDGRGKAAQTAYEVVERFLEHSLVLCRPRTGRTHQIRVHMAQIGHPVICDAIYQPGGGGSLTASQLLGRRSRPGEPVVLDRQALHAHRLSFQHPFEDKLVECESPLPDDLVRVVEILREGLTK